VNCDLRLPPAGATDMVNFRSRKRCSSDFGATFTTHASVTLMRTTPEENAAIAGYRETRPSRGPVAAYPPSRGP
jgi:uncharacterized protein (UPF0261 family)